MSGHEFENLVSRLERIEQLLTKLVGGLPEIEAEHVESTKVAPEITELEMQTALQAEGHFILATQGMAAYKKFWQEQLKKSKRPRLKRAA